MKPKHPKFGWQTPGNDGDYRVGIFKDAYELAVDAAAAQGKSLKEIVSAAVRHYVWPKGQ